MLTDDVILCAYCEQRPATCFGAYEGCDPAAACDECCGHGCEDGHCDPIQTGFDDEREANA